MALLHALHSLSPRHRWRLVVAHFNHRLRGAESDADEQFVRETARRLGLRFVRGAAPATAFSRRHKSSIEMTARKLRHDFLARTARRLKIKTVALAHHADDQVELFFLRLLRGSSGGGLAGMRWSGPSPSDAKVQLIRPLLDLTKADLRAGAEAKSISFREDATNAEVDFLRNRVRNKLLPLLAREYQPALVKTTLRTMELLGAEAGFLGESAAAWLRAKRPANFSRLHIALQRQIIQMQLLRMGIVPQFDLIEQLRTKVGQPISVRPELAVWRDRSGRIAPKALIRSAFNLDEAVVQLGGGSGETVFGGLKIRWQTFPGGSGAKGMPKFSARVEFFDADKVGSRVVLRHWRAGDRFQPIGLSGPVKLQDLFTNRRIPRPLRHQLVVATSASGELFWVEGLRIAERFKLDKQTRRRLKWRWFGRQSPVAGGKGPC